jgi:hypothetical protein
MAELGVDDDLRLDQPCGPPRTNSMAVHLRFDPQGRGVGYVLAVAKSHRVTALSANSPVRAARLEPARAFRLGRSFFEAAAAAEFAMPGWCW